MAKGIEGWADRPHLEGSTESCSRYVDEKFLKFEQRDRDPMKRERKSLAMPTDSAEDARR